jgi:diguanylate cyclase (GGDEF)-like protein/PAS domain S-box-containing protein
MTLRNSIFIAIFITFASIFIIFFLFFKNIESSLYSYILPHVKEDTYEIVDSAKKYIERDEIDSLHRFTDRKLSADEYIDAFYILDEYGDQIFSSNRKNLKDLVEPKEVSPIRNLESQNSIHKFLKSEIELFYSGELKKYQIFIQLDTLYIHNIIFSGAELHSTILIVFILFISVIYYFLIERHINSPIRDILQSITDRRVLPEKEIFIRDLSVLSRAIRRYQLRIRNDEAKMLMYIETIDKYIPSTSTDKEGKITHVSRAFEQITGYSKDELIGITHSIIKDPSTDKVVFEEMWGEITNGGVWRGELRNIKKNGDYFWAYTLITPKFNDYGKIDGYTAIRQDITDKKLLETVSITDELTNIYNRRYFNEVITKEISRAKRGKEYLTLVIFDVDYFKKYNDYYGHHAGDIALRKVALFVDEKTRRGSDFVFRLGGEEFGVIFSGLNLGQSIKFADFLRKGIEELEIEHFQSDVGIYLTVSMGIITRKGELIPDETKFYQMADQALYEAKERGRNRVEAFDDEDEVELTLEKWEGGRE